MPVDAPDAARIAAEPFQLRPFDEGDLALYAALFTSADVMREVGVPFGPEHAARAAASSLAHQRDAHGRFRHWVVEHAEGTAGLLGLALRGARWPGGEAELGVLLWPAWQARGAATAAIRAIRPWAFSTAGLVRLTCHHGEAHERAARLMRRVGFSRATARADSPWPVGWALAADTLVGNANPASLG